MINRWLTSETGSGSYYITDLLSFLGTQLKATALSCMDSLKEALMNKVLAISFSRQVK